MQTPGAGPSTPFPSSSTARPAYATTSRARTSSTFGYLSRRRPQTPIRDSADLSDAPTTPPFSRLLGSMLGSPFLTTSLQLAGDADADAAEEDQEAVDGAPLSVPRAETATRPPSPAPTDAFSLISPPSSPTFAATQRGQHQLLPDDVFSLYGAAPGCGLFGSPAPSGLSYAYGGALGLGRREPPRARGLLPRLFEALAATPTKKGKSRAHARGAATSPLEYTHSAYEDWAGAEPLDGEEGELVVVDEACFVAAPADAALAVTGLDVVALLPPELALYILAHLDVRTVARCGAVSRGWRALALDNLLWRELFEARRDDGWKVNLARTAGKRGAAAGLGEPVGMERRGSERSLLAAMARARRDSERSLRSLMAHRSPFGALALSPTEEEEHAEYPLAPAPAPAAAGALDWRALYQTRAELDRRWASGEPEVTKLAGHADSVYCLEFDRTRIITGSRDRTIKVWSLHDGRPLGTFFGHAGSVLCLKFDQDWEERGREGLMVSGSSDCSILVWRMWAAARGEVRAEVSCVLKGHTGGVLDLQMDEQSIVSWCARFFSIWLFASF
jgi:F-box and WD-40 domain protein 1/11